MECQLASLGQNPMSRRPGIFFPELLSSLLGKEIKLVKMEGEGTMGDKGIWESGRERGNRVKVRAKG